MNLLDYIKDHLLYLDGGMGTLLQERGLEPGEPPEKWNLSHPEEIVSIHRAYAEAGSQLIIANTFGANALHYSSEDLDAVISAGIACARQACEGIKHPTWVALDVGPTGKLLAPYGTLDFEDAVAIFSETVRRGVKYGADAIFIETMNDSYEAKAALLAAKEHSSLPVFVSCAYGEDGCLMTGASPAAMVAMLEGMGADVIGVNCSLGPKALEKVVRQYLAHASVPVLFKPNAGLPSVIGGNTVYDIGPDDFAADVSALVAEGVRAVGGCCGTTPAHIAALVKAVGQYTPVPITEKNECVISSYTHTVSFGTRPLLIGERINPTGKKRFKEALRAHDIDYIVREGVAQQERGVHVLDVNVGLPEIDECELLASSVTALQAVTDLPLQIDTSNHDAMEAALRRYNGKPLINSVNGTQESMDAVFPLAKKYGGVLIALTLDESGIPATADGRIAVARRILAEAEKYGIAKKNIVFDPLALSISADAHAAVETLKAVSRIKTELGCFTSLGVSNVSFGLPAREVIGATFFAEALANGLDAAIMNPHSVDMMKIYHAHLALKGLDENCADYIAYASSLPQAATAAPTSSAVQATSSSVHTETTELQRAVIRGLSKDAAALTTALLTSKEPLAIIREEIIPALDTVGAGFEKQTIYLPQLLMSAEAARAAFEVIRTAMPQNHTDDGPTVVLATVHGDIHDIGKNIVRMLLENYGFPVCDLGRDVPPETVVETVVRLHAPIAGLSALMTTTVPAMAETIRQLRQKAPWCKIVVGGAVLTAEYAAQIGADYYAKDAMETVRYAASFKTRA